MTARPSCPKTSNRLIGALPDPSCPLARRARRVADKLEHGTPSRAVHAAAADLLCDLLTLTDSGVTYDEDGLLTGDFDE